jgi:MbtH protein
MQDQDAFKSYDVIVKHEEQYSIWPTEKAIPNGWKSVGKQGNKTECLDYIKIVWTDIRPLSLRKKMDEASKRPPAVVAERAEPPEALTLSRSFSRLLTWILAGQVAVATALMCAVIAKKVLRS